MSTRVILVGENNPYSSDPEFALYCHPPGCAAYRLRRILGLPQHQYLALHRTNLCDGAWSIWNQPQVQERARQILRELAPEIPWGSAAADAAQEAAS
jgi:hypothetical protein